MKVSVNFQYRAQGPFIFTKKVMLRANVREFPFSATVQEWGCGLDFDLWAVRNEDPCLHPFPFLPPSITIPGEFPYFLQQNLTLWVKHEGHGPLLLGRQSIRHARQSLYSRRFAASHLLESRRLLKGARAEKNTTSVFQENIPGICC